MQCVKGKGCCSLDPVPALAVQLGGEGTRFRKKKKKKKEKKKKKAAAMKRMLGKRAATGDEKSIAGQVNCTPSHSPTQSSSSVQLASLANT